MIKILIADDHTIMRKGLNQLFSISHDIKVGGEAKNGDEVLEKLKKEPFDLLLLDVSMPGISGIELIGKVKKLYTHMPILVLSMHNESQIARRKLKAGASGYITKDSDPEMLMDAIRKVAAGGHFITPDLAEQLVFDKNTESEIAPQELLSKRELQVLRMLSTGQGINQIADTLAISNKTVSTHKARLMQKLKIDNNAQLVRYAIKHRLPE